MNPNYSIKIDFEKGTKDPERVFSTMLGLINAFKEYDKNLAKIISADLKPEIFLEDITTGSINTTIVSVLKKIDDGALKELDWKQLVGAYLVKGKYKLIQYFEDRETVNSYQEIEDLNSSLLTLAHQADVVHLPSFSPIPPQLLLENIKDISDAMSSLQLNDSVAFIGLNEEIEINKNFKLPEDKIETILTEQVVTSKRKLVLKVKKPDFLGHSKWEMKHGGKAVSVKIANIEWLNKFHKQEVSVLPGDAIKCLVKIVESIDKNGDLVSEEYAIIEVYEIIKNLQFQRKLY